MLKAIITRETLERACGAAQSPLHGALVQRALLDAAFRLVADPADWKAPIDKRIHADSCEFSPEVIQDAVMFFTATEASVERIGEDLHVRARGYRAGPAGG